MVPILVIVTFVRARIRHAQLERYVFSMSGVDHGMGCLWERVALEGPQIISDKTSRRLVLRDIRTPEGRVRS